MAFWAMISGGRKREFSFLFYFLLYSYHLSPGQDEMCNESCIPIQSIILKMVSKMSLRLDFRRELAVYARISVRQHDCMPIIVSAPSTCFA